MGIPPLPGCSDRGAGSTEYELCWRQRRAMGQRIDKGPMGESPSGAEAEVIVLSQWLFHLSYRRRREKERRSGRGDSVAVSDVV